MTIFLGFRTNDLAFGFIDSVSFSLDLKERNTSQPKLWGMKNYFLSIASVGRLVHNEAGQRLNSSLCDELDRLSLNLDQMIKFIQEKHDYHYNREVKDGASSSLIIFGYDTSSGPFMCESRCKSDIRELNNIEENELLSVGINHDQYRAAGLEIFKKELDNNTLDLRDWMAPTFEEVNSGEFVSYPLIYTLYAPNERVSGAIHHENFFPREEALVIQLTHLS